MHEAIRQFDWNPKPRELRRFGCTLAIGLCVPATVLTVRARLVPPGPALILAGIAVVSAVVAIWQPTRLIWPYRIWMLVARSLALLLQTILLCAFFVLVLTPVGLALRVARRDPLERRRDPDRDTYWISVRPPTDRRRYFRQY